MIVVGGEWSWIFNCSGILKILLVQQINPYIKRRSPDISASHRLSFIITTRSLTFLSYIQSTHTMASSTLSSSSSISADEAKAMTMHQIHMEGMKNSVEQLITVNTFIYFPIKPCSIPILSKFLFSHYYLLSNTFEKFLVP